MLRNILRNIMKLATLALENGDDDDDETKRRESDPVPVFRCHGWNGREGKEESFC